MASKRSRKVKKRQKALQRRRQQQTSTHPRPATIPPEHADHVGMTLTGEMLQPIRLHYDVLDAGELRAVFTTLRCIDDDAPRKRWVWLYTDEAQSLHFKVTPAADNVVLGEFVCKSETEIVLNLRSIERATQALVFFDQQIPRTVARVTSATISNRLLSVAEAGSLTSLDHYFDQADVVIQEPASLMQTFNDIASKTPDAYGRLASLLQQVEDDAKEPVPAMERLSLNFYEEGIRSVEAFLAPRKVIAMQHWQGNTTYTYHDLVQDMLRHGDIETGETDTHLCKNTPVYTFSILNIGKRILRILYRKTFGRALTMSTTDPSVDVSLTAQLCSLMRSDDYTDWLQAWELLRDTMPASITTFDALEALFALDVHDCSVTDMFYTLEMALHNEGLEDARLTAQRAEFTRWVYTHFTEENALNLGNFRGYEAASLWDLDQREQAEALFQALIETYPNFAWGYIWWGDQYWMSDWSYVYPPDYDRAEALYRQALAQPDLDDRDGVQDRLDNLSAEQAHPEKRERIQKVRLEHIQRRKNVE